MTELSLMDPDGEAEVSLEPVGGSTAIGKTDESAAPDSAAPEAGAPEEAAPAPAPRPASGQSRPGVIQLSIKEKSALFAAYMPFVTGGGIFVPTSRAAQLGDELYLILTLMDDPNKLAITGKVVWITPQGVPGRQQGIGIQFALDDTGELARSKIETIIGGAGKTGRNTHTI